MTPGPKPSGNDPRDFRECSFIRHGIACPRCSDRRNVIIDTRETSEGSTIRRRRMCINRHRFTTWEQIGKPSLQPEPAEIISGVYA
jgi:Transcriptional repressor NrdR-like, N-terminal domain